MIKKLFAIPFLLLTIYIGANSQPITLKTWQVYEIAFKASNTFENPYLECVKSEGDPYAIARFRNASGSATGKIYEVPAFWDGGNTWKFRFAPPQSGTWEYETLSSDRGLNKKKGKIQVSDWTDEELKMNATRRGFIYVNQSPSRAGRYLVYADGTPCLWISDTWWDWTNRRITSESFRNLVDTRAEQGFNIGQLFFPGNGWGRESSMLDPTYTILDLEHIRKIENLIQYANSKGITVWIHAWWSRKDIVRTIGEEKMRRWWKYVVDRLHAYNVIWVLAGEFNMNNYGGFPLQFWNNLGQMIKDEDPYDRIIGVHPTPPTWGAGMEAPQWSTATTIHEQSWLDYNQSQCGHHLWSNEFIPWIIREAYEKQPAKPIVVTEAWYEFIEGNPSAKDIRFGAWSAFFSGAAGHTYGGGHIWIGHTPENPKRGGSWPLDTSFRVNTCFYPGAVSMSFMSKYLNAMKWWELEPHPELIMESPSPYCAANPGKEYLVYMRYGGSFKLDFTSMSENDKFNYEWVDLVNSKVARTGTVSGGKVIQLKCREDYPGYLEHKDWLVRIYKD